MQDANELDRKFHQEETEDDYRTTWDKIQEIIHLPVSDIEDSINGKLAAENLEDQTKFHFITT